MKLVISETVNDIPVVTEKENIIVISDFDTGAGSIPLSTVTGKGSLVVGTASGAVAELVVGTNGYVPVADSAEATGIKWIATTGLVGSDVTGWINPSQTWAYASATTITVPSGAASIYSIGDKVRINQSGLKYFYIVGVADTVLTVTGGDNYTVANAAITSPYYSKAATPVGFPSYFAFTTGCNPQGFTGTPITSFAFSISGRLLTYHLSISGTSNATSFTCTLPATVSVATQMLFRAQDNTANLTVGLASPAATTLTFYPTVAAGVWTASNTKAALVAGGFYWI